MNYRPISHSLIDKFLLMESSAMKRAMPFGEQVDVSSDESSSSDGDDHKAESEQMSNNIAVDQVVEELVSEGTKTICDHLDMVKCESEHMSDNLNIGQGVEELVSEDALLRRARMYQEYMQLVPIPTQTHSTIPCISWAGLAASIKKLYGQPLHYLTNLCMKQRDQMRVGADDEVDPLEMLIHPTKAESSIWLMEEVHRRTSSPHYLAKLWLADPMYHVYIDPVFPKLQNPSK
uniref:Protein RDM1 isoform X5 n=1 Tax=Nicotiana tabacum TaxID=4097 RepID=A0A1S3X045_TOBAC|nr:PREDICTED: protein RDM1-like isoform X5 [Nicotiana tabacum]